MKIGAIHIKKGKFAKPRASAAEERARLEADFKRMTHAANHEPEWEEDDEAQEARRKKRLKIAVISTACLLAVVLIGLGIFLWSYSRDDGLIFDNVYALDINLGGMSQEQATQVLEEKAQAVYGAPLTIQLQDRTLVLTPEETKAQLDAAALAEAACRYGRDGNMFDRARPVGSVSEYLHPGGGGLPHVGHRVHPGCGESAECGFGEYVDPAGGHSGGPAPRPERLPPVRQRGG